MRAIMLLAVLFLGSKNREAHLLDVRWVWRAAAPAAGVYHSEQTTE